MAEANVHATILLATSWQALKREQLGNQRTSLCDCTVVIVFAAFYIEASARHIIENMGHLSEMKKFLHNDDPGLFHMMAWFYNKNVAHKKAASWKQLSNDQTIKQKLNRKFPGINRIRDFRNTVAHGVINKRLATSTKAQHLRAQSKEIVNSLFNIALRRGFVIPRSTPYEIAIRDTN